MGLYASCGGAFSAQGVRGEQSARDHNHKRARVVLCRSCPRKLKLYISSLAPPDPACSWVVGSAYSLVRINGDHSRRQLYLAVTTLECPGRARAAAPRYTRYTYRIHALP